MTAVALTGTSLQDGLPAKPSPRLGVTFCPQQIKLTVMQTDNALTPSVAVLTEVWTSALRSYCCNLLRVTQPYQSLVGTYTWTFTLAHCQEMCAEK